MNLQNQELDGNSLNLIFQMIRNMEVPVSTLIEESKKINEIESPGNDDDSKSIIFNNSLEIKEMIERVIQHLKSNQKEEPLIFDIYEMNDAVRNTCEGKIDPKKISVTDRSWLLNLEKEVFKNIERREIHLSDLSYNLAVSKRQLNRKIRNLLWLTPNKYIRILKLHRAKELIDAFQFDSISQISYAVGYYDTHYFSKLFYNQYNITPRELLVAKRW